MRIPANLVERQSLFWDLVQRCLVSRNDRKMNYERLRHYFLFGAAPDCDPASHNKINPVIDTLKSFLFAADTTRFSVKLGAGVDMTVEAPRVPPMVQRLNDIWEDSNADIIFGNAVTWSLVKNTSIIKTVMRGKQLHPWMVDPENFGVLREDVPMISRQEAFCEVFLTTRSQLERDLWNNPSRSVILSRVTASRTSDNDLPAGVQRIITSSFYPTAQGQAPAPLVSSDLYRPRTSEELIEGYELWVWDDEIASVDPHTGERGGYRVVTLLDPAIVIYDRAAFNPETKDGLQMFIEGEHPYTQICPNPSPDYFWGYSEVERLTMLQDMREHAVRQVQSMLDLNVNSPKALQGMWGAVEEKDLALRKMNALISTIGTDPTAKVTEFKPQIPTDIWAFIREIDNQFQETSSINNILGGRGEAGVRSKGQTDRLAQLGSSRPKNRALIIEDSLERMATLYLKLDQSFNPSPLKSRPSGDEEPVVFTSKMFTGDFMVKVDAHSSSPVFMEEQRNIILDLFDRGIVDGDAVLDVIQPQNAQMLKVRYKEMETARAAAKAREEAVSIAEAKGKLTRMPGA